MLLIPILIVIAVLIGVIEWQQHQKNIRKLPIRININGIRGKSTVTRLVTGIFIEAGYKTVGKTTGTSARKIYWNRTEEEPIKRPAEGPNINEQKRVVASTAKTGAEALVSECMAVNPDYQKVFQEKLLQANIGVIVNVLDDHMDVMGPTLDEVADAFTSTIPYNGQLIITDDAYKDFFIQEASRRNTNVIVADTDRIETSFLRQFNYTLFPENVALALAVAESMGIDEDTSRRGMLQANPDPGALQVIDIQHGSKSAHFINGFAANDSTSAIHIWENLKKQEHPSERLVILMNCRDDRVDRTNQFRDEVLPHLPIDTLVLIGKRAEPILKAVKQGDLQVNHVLDLQKKKTDHIYRRLLETVDDNVIYGIGNVHGAAEPLVDKIQEREGQ